MAQDELAAMEKNSRLAMFHQRQKFHQAVPEHQRRGRDAVNHAVLESISPMRYSIEYGITGFAAQQRIDQGDEGMRTAGSEAQAAHNPLVVERDAQRVYSVSNVFSTKSVHLGIMKMSLEIEIPFAKYQNTTTICMKGRNFGPTPHPGSQDVGPSSVSHRVVQCGAHQCPFVHLSKHDRRPSPKRPPKRDRGTDGLWRDLKRDKGREKTLCRSSKIDEEIIHVKGNPKREGANRTRHKDHWSVTTL